MSMYADYLGNILSQPFLTPQERAWMTRSERRVILNSEPPTESATSRANTEQERETLRGDLPTDG